MAVQNTTAILNSNIFDNESYTLIRSEVFHYLQLTDEERELFSSSSKIESIPDIIFYSENGENKAILDFSNASDKDKKYLDILFSDLTNLNGISLTNAIYLDEKNGIKDKSLTSSLLFTEFKNNILITKVLNSIDSGDLNKVFFGSYFIDIPVLTTDSVWSNKTSKTFSSIINLNPNSTPNFLNLNLQPGDLVEIVNSSSLNNQQRFEILEVSELNNKQIIKSKNKIKNEFLVGKNTVLNFYTKTKLKNLQESTLNKTKTGCCRDLKTKKYYDSSTEYECNIRSNGSYVFFAGEKCIDTTTPILPSITVNSNIIEVKKAEFVLYNTTDLIELQVGIVDNSFTINGINYSSYPIQIGKIYKFVQNDESNLGYPLRFSISSTTDPGVELEYYQRDCFGVIYPEAIGSELYIKVTENTFSSLYLATEKLTEDNKRILGPMLLVVS